MLYNAVKGLAILLKLLRSPLEPSNHSSYYLPSLPKVRVPSQKERPFVGTNHYQEIQTLVAGLDGTYFFGFP